MPGRTRHGTSLRAAAITLTLCGALGPALPAAAASSPPPEPPAGAGTIHPPPAVPSARPHAKKPKPLYTFKQQRPCIRSTVGGVALKRKPWPQDLLQIRKAHRFATGKGQTVAVIDTGVSKTHPRQLGKRLVGGGDYVKTKDNGLKDCDGHGTEVAGIIAAKTPHDVGFEGMAPDATILSVRTNSTNFTAKGSNGPGHPGSLKELAQAVSWVAQYPHPPNGRVSAINISLTDCVEPSRIPVPGARELRAAIHYAVHTKHIVVVVAAGNTAKSAQKGCTRNNTGPNRPRAIPIPAWFGDDVLTVGAIGEDGNPAGFSVAGPWVDVAAPGKDLISLDPAGPGLVNRTSEPKDGQSGAGDAAAPLDGTSFAAPYVSGLVALVRQRFPKLSAEQVAHRITFTAQHPGNPDGRDEQVGYGMIDPVAALTDVVPPKSRTNPADAGSAPATLPPPYEKNWTPAIVALSSSGGALGLLAVVAFVTHTIRRNRHDSE
jgi:membrane-anchored mycosin MYCP